MAGLATNPDLCPCGVLVLNQTGGIGWTRWRMISSSRPSSLVKPKSSHSLFFYSDIQRWTLSELVDVALKGGVL